LPNLEVGAASSREEAIFPTDREVLKFVGIRDIKGIFGCRNGHNARRRIQLHTASFAW